MPYRCVSLPREQHSNTRVRISTAATAKTSTVIIVILGKLGALQQLLIHVLECTRVAQEKGVWRPLEQSLGPRQASKHSPGTASRRSLTTRQSGRKDARPGPDPTRFFTAKSFRKTDADRMQHASTRKGTGTPRNMQEDTKKMRRKVYVIKKRSPHRTSERSDPAPSLCRGFFIRQNRRRLAQEGRTSCTDQIEYGGSIKKEQTISRSAETHVEEPHASARRAGVNSQVWKQAPESRARSGTHLAMPRRQRGGGVWLAANDGTTSARDHPPTRKKNTIVFVSAMRKTRPRVPLLPVL